MFLASTGGRSRGMNENNLYAEKVSGHSKGHASRASDTRKKMCKGPSNIGGNYACALERTEAKTIDDP